jgi:hypothetical protein
MSVAIEALVAVAREYIRSEGDGRDVGISQVLEELSYKFGDRFPKWPDAYTVLEVIEALWADPHIDQVPNTGWVAFAWNERGGSIRPSLRTRRCSTV